MVLGHEGVGVVADVGPDATLLKKGDRVGWGFLQDTCGNCQLCLDGTETFCPERKLYGFADHDQGSLAYGIVKKETRIFKIPEQLSDEDAAPLMCAGATVFNALDSYGAKPTQRVGVIGVGGLGHLAIQVR
jgi:D-arabinose 1-dehydrogenase-like Zn-dependent alcohol dehydrogenase